MTKKELAARVADKAQLTNRQAETIVGIFLTCVAEALREGDKVELRGFGSFRTRSRKARRGRNPRTGDAIQVPAKKVPFFAAGEVLRKKVASAKRGETEVVLRGSRTENLEIWRERMAPAPARMTAAKLLSLSQAGAAMA